MDRPLQKGIKVTLKKLRKSFRVMDYVEALILRIRKDPANAEINCFSIRPRDTAARYGVIA